VFLVNSRLGHFSATSRSSPSKSGHRQRHSLSRSYGVSLPSSLITVLSSTLGYSPHPPELVCGTDSHKSHIEAFLGSMIRVSLCHEDSYSHLSVKGQWIFLPSPPTCLNRLFQQAADLSLLRHPIAQTIYSWYRNIQPVYHRLRPSASP
jgi:hypothetical protein